MRIARLVPAFLLFAALLAASPEQEFKNANALYKKGDFAGAVQAYRGILSSGVEDWRVYFNLGNACYKQKDPGRAVLNYERAVRLNPQDGRVRGNLEFVRLQLKDRFQEEAQGATARLLNSLFNILSTGEAAAVFLGIFLLLQALWTVYLLRRDPGTRTAATLASSILLALLLILGPLLSVKLYRAHGVEHGVLLAPTVTAKSAPQADATNLFVAHEGTKVRLYEQVEGWQRVALPNGLTGFIPLESFEKI